VKKKALQEARLAHVREVCMNVLRRDGAYSDRAWLAQAVLNILEGNIDAQIEEEHGVKPR
jgi:hypothetical protein